MKHLVAIIIAITSHPTFAGTIGSYDQISNLPGRITSNKDDSHYRGPLYENAKENPKDGLDRRTPSRILLETYVQNDGRVDVSALQALLLKSAANQEAAFQVVCQKEKKVAGAEYCQRKLSDFSSDSSEEAQKLLKKFVKEELTIARKFADNSVKKAIQLSKSLPPLIGERNLNSKEAYAFIETLFNALDVYASINFEDYTFGNMYKNLALFGQILTPQIVDGKVEAANLINPATGEYLNSENLTQLKDAVSEFDPPDSGLWRRPTKPISSFDTTRYDGQSQGIDESLLNPAIPTDVTFSKVKLGGVTPKMDVKIGKDTFKLKFNVSTGRPADEGTGLGALSSYSRGTLETQTETVVNNLAAALGFSVDPTYYKNTVRLFLKDDFSKNTDRETYEANFQKAYKDLIEELEEGSSVKRTTPIAANWNFRSAFSVIKTLETGEQQGRKYIELQGASLEKRPDGEEEIEVGGFNKALLGRSLKREFRGLQAFYAWINDDDAKDLNSELKLVKTKGEDGKEDYKIVFSASDMGATLGWIFGKGQPNIFSSQLVDFEKSDASKGIIALKIQTYARYDIWKSLTINDLRWGTRLIAQLTPQQIRRAFLTAGYPYYVAEIFTQKLLNRRDQLLEVTGLLNKTIPAHGTGEPVQLKALSSLKPGVVFKVPGYEDCFDKNGNLVEVAGKCDKQWTDTLNPIKEGSREREVVDALLWGEVPKIADPFVRRLQRYDFMKALSTTQGAFFEGVSVGADSFIPARYIIENPLKDLDPSSEKKPWWIIDVFRTGYGISRAKQLDIQFDAAGFEMNPEDTNFDLRFSKTWEFIRIRAVRDPKEFADGIIKIYAPQNMFVTAVKNLSEKMASEMLPGDVLISSTYLAPGFTVKFFPTLTPLTLVSPQLRIGASHAVTNRVTLVRSEGEKMLANWQDLIKSDLGGNVSLKLFVLHLAQLRQRLTRLSQSDRLYEFDLSQPEQKKLLMSNLKRSLPKFDSPSEQSLFKSLAISNKSIKQKESLRSMGMVGLPTFLDYKRYQEVAVRDPQNGNLKESFLSYKKSKNSRGLLMFEAKVLNSNEVSSEAVADKDGSIFARFEIDYSRSWAKRSDFKKVAKDLLPLLPSSFAQFDPNQVGHYCGTLEIAGEIFYSKKAFDDIFSQNLTKEQICDRFTKSFVSSVPEIPNLCATAMDNIEPFKLSDRLGRSFEDKSRIRSALIATRAFTENFWSAQKTYANRELSTLSPTGREKAKKAISKIVALLETRPLRHHVLNTLQGLTSDAHVYRSAKVASTLGCLPNQENEIKLNKLDAGGHKLIGIEKANSILEYTDTQVDAVHDAVRKYFYDFLFKTSVVGPASPEERGAISGRR